MIEAAGMTLPAVNVPMSISEPIAQSPTAPVGSGPDIGFLGRQPILDRKGRLVAYELLFRSDDRDARTISDTRATATVIKRAFAELGISEVLGPHAGFINFGRELLSEDLIELLPRERIVIELLETIVPVPALVERVQTLRKRGFRIALDDYVGADARQAMLLPHVDIIKVDIAGVGADRLESVTRELRPLGKQLLAEKVETREEADLCRTLGYALFQGYYFARPALVASRQISPSDRAVLKLSTLVASGADNFAIEAVFRANPDLSVFLLRIVNSAAAGLQQRVASLRHALLVIGTRRLSRWIQILIYAMADGAATGFPSPLTTMAATRAKFMESAAGSAYPHMPGLPEQAFMTGMFSLVAALFGSTLEETVLPLPLPEDIKQALMTRAGPLGHLVTLAEALESADEHSIAVALDAIPGGMSSPCSELYRQAMLWADALSRSA